MCYLFHVCIKSFENLALSWNKHVSEQCESLINIALQLKIIIAPWAITANKGLMLSLVTEIKIFQFWPSAIKRN